MFESPPHYFFSGFSGFALQGAAGLWTPNKLPRNHGDWLKCELHDESDGRTLKI